MNGPDAVRPDALIGFIHSIAPVHFSTWVYSASVQCACHASFCICSFFESRVESVKVHFGPNDNLLKTCSRVKHRHKLYRHQTSKKLFYRTCRIPALSYPSSLYPQPTMQFDDVVPMFFPTACIDKICDHHRCRVSETILSTQLGLPAV